MRESVDTIQGKVAGIVDQDESTANIDSTDYSLRLNYMNKAQQEWAEIQNWQTLFKEYNMLVSTSTGNASIVLPDDFRKLAGLPHITLDGKTTKTFPEVLPQQDSYKASEERMWLLGNPNSGYIMRVFGATLASGASVKVPYFSSAGSLVSPANIPVIPNTDYLVQRTISMIWESREDPRFPQAKAEAERILQNMMEKENTFNEASDYYRAKTIEETRFNDFKWGK